MVTGRNLPGCEHWQQPSRMVAKIFSSVSSGRRKIGESEAGTVVVWFIVTSVRLHARFLKIKLDKSLYASAK